MVSPAPQKGLIETIGRAAGGTLGRAPSLGLCEMVAGALLLPLAKQSQRTTPRTALLGKSLHSRLTHTLSKASPVMWELEQSLENLGATAWESLLFLGLSTGITRAGTCASTHRCQRQSRNLAKPCHPSGQKLLIGYPGATSVFQVCSACQCNVPKKSKLQTWKKW